ncbi:MAG: DUF5056 domain-containing protein [Bacteroidales bacterium]|jgi:hypothetical protein|nr:DUF5056 domain-containing protein [Bacteroidales bacterium]
MNKDDQLIYNFFKENKIEIEDKDFSKNLMRQIARKKSKRFAKIWNICCLIIGVLIFIFLFYSFNNYIVDFFVVAKNYLFKTFSMFRLSADGFLLKDSFLPLIYVCLGVPWLYSIFVAIRNIRT